MCLADPRTSRFARFLLPAGLLCVVASNLWRALSSKPVAHAGAVDFGQGFLVGLGLTLLIAALVVGRSRMKRA
jgi:hypothetical protein